MSNVSIEEKWIAGDPGPKLMMLELCKCPFDMTCVYWNVPQWLCCGWVETSFSLLETKKTVRLHLNITLYYSIFLVVGLTYLSIIAHNIFFHPTKTKSSETRAIWRTLVEFNELFGCLILIIVLPTLIDTFLPHTSYNHNNIFVMFHPYHLFLMYDFKVLLYLFFLLKIIRVNYTWVN
jgi:hypothetical protein